MEKSSKLKNNKEFLQYLCVCSPKTRKAIINLAKKDEILALMECCINILNGNVKLTDAEKKRLSRHRAMIRKITAKSPVSKKKKILCQRGGFLPLLLAPLLSVLSSVAGAAISRAI